MKPSITDLAADLHEGNLSPDSLDELRDRLASDDGAVDEFVMETFLLDQLCEQLGDTQLREHAISKTVGDFEVTGASAHEASAKQRKQSPLQWASRHPKGPAFAIAATMLIAALVVMGLIPVKEWMAGGGKRDGGVEAQEKKHQEFVARLSNWQNDVWLEDTRPPLDDPRLKIGRRLKIETGLIEVTYLTGARVVIEGPSEFYIGGTEAQRQKAQATRPAERARKESEGGSKKIARSSTPKSSLLNSKSSLANSGYLTHGKLVARVEGEKAQGFTINAPSGRVEDYGTEFGVEVQSGGDLEVVVLSGEVDVVGETRDGRQQRVRLTADQAASVASDGSAVTRRKKLDLRFVAAMRSRLKMIDRKPIVVASSAENYQESPSTTTNKITRYEVQSGENRKLVLAASWESADSNISATWKGNEAFTTAVNSAGGRNSAILYLDDPTPGIGDIVVTFGEPTASRIGIASLMNAAEGVLEITTAKGTAGQLSKMEPAMFVMGVYTTNDHRGGKIQGPFSRTLYSGESGSSRGDAGYQIEAIAGLKNYTWTVAQPSGDNHVLAAFADASYEASAAIESEAEITQANESDNSH